MGHYRYQRIRLPEAHETSVKLGRQEQNQNFKHLGTQCESRDKVAYVSNVSCQFQDFLLDTSHVVASMFMP